MTTTTDSKHHEMDASKQVTLTMIEIKEIVYQLKSSMESMKTDTSYQKADESGILDEKKVMLEQIIHKLEN